jgi:DNA polymerase-1
MSTAPRLLLVDGHAYAYRSFFAIRTLTSPQGTPTNAIFGFVKAVMKLREWLAPSHAVVVWDGGLAEERLQLVPGYKADRPPMPSDLEQQLDQIVAWVEASGMASHCRDGVEADDWIAALAAPAAAGGLGVVIASSDKDFMQLVSDQVALANPGDKEERLWTAAEVREKTGVLPGQIVDYLSLVGDSVDNIPGVAGVGAKTAASLLQQFGSVTNLLERLGEVPSARVRASLEQSREALTRNQAMIRLKADFPGVPALEEMRVKPPDVPRLRELYAGWGFHSLLRALPSESTPQQGELF